ncbi:hypothetical protein V1504DRAFT_10646 [Lipomyces starkeyi]
MFRISSYLLYFIMVLFDALFCVHIMFVLYNVNQLVILVSKCNCIFLITCSDVACLELLWLKIMVFLQFTDLSNVAIYTIT